MYAIIDIETTGGSARLEKITEIAILQHDGSKITGKFVTLVNPEREIPYYITSLTGISNEMVERAPKFYEVAKKVVEFTEGRTIVAHNARFDYSFLRQEFKKLGYNFRKNLLDTVSLSRKLIPGHKSYSLGNICRDLNIMIDGRHRAEGDAIATARLFEILLEKNKMVHGDHGGLIQNTKLAKLNPNLDISRLDIIPDEPGIYYFYNESHDLIYIGKSRSLQKRIQAHLSNNSTNRSMEMRDQIAFIDWEVTGSELVALLRESDEIKQNKPIYNRAQRRSGSRWGIYWSTDSNGYINLRHGVLEADKNLLCTFPMKHQAKATLDNLIDKYRLCQKLCGIYETSGFCFHYNVGLCKGACGMVEAPEAYNERAGKAINEFTFSRKNFFIIDKGRSPDERSAIKILNGKYAGYGYFNINDMGFGLDALHDCIQSRDDNKDTHSILKQHMKGYKIEKIIEF